ncbi:LysR family transcriptional regulator [Methylorubrum populi]|uniref:LysR family transcriptional regulator n=1 Tax=Methylobacterium radiotolerans TaxID=31998 RepID=A0ABU7TAC1_9HYPH|nr:LysR family transcriptional regulator [Methylobacterium sp. B4]PXW55884.1 LysR family transcriptional regulator [Methylobacterium sp. B4]
MLRESLNAMVAFVAVARTGNFTRAAAQLGVSQPALSQTVRRLETRLGVRLLARTTRSVSPTEAGERLLKAVELRLERIEAGLASVEEMRDKPAGSVRIVADEHAADTVLWPILCGVLPNHPDIAVEVVVQNGPTNGLAARFDAGVQLGGLVAKEMLTVPIGPALRMAAVGAPGYFARYPEPQRPEDLAGHRCINLRLPDHSGLDAWKFGRDGREIQVRVGGQVVFNTLGLILRATLDGFGIAFLPEDRVQAHLESRDLVHVLAEWSPPRPGYHLYYPCHRQSSPALSLLVEALRYRV